MDLDKVRNDIALHGKATYHVCSRCVTYFATGEYMCCGYIGCRMPVPGSMAQDLYDEWSLKEKDGTVLDFKRCLRCLISNQECVALPSVFDDKLKKIALFMKDLDADEDTSLENPAPLTSEQRYSRKFRLMTACSEISRAVARRFSPQATHLNLHSGAIDADDDPQSQVRPNGRKRDKMTIAATQEGKKRKFEAAVAKAAENSDDETPTPKKKFRASRAEIDPLAEAQSAYDKFGTELTAAMTSRLAAKGQEKAKLTRDIKRLNALRHDITSKFAVKK